MNDATASKQAGRGIEPENITAVYRTKLAKGFRFTDQNGNVLRGKATRPYTHMAISHWPNGGSSFLSFHSTPNPTKTYHTVTIERVLPIAEA